MTPSMKKPLASVEKQPSPEALALEFLAVGRHFQLGHLPTESRHPRTTRLSQLATEDLTAAIRLLQDVEIDALQDLKGKRTLIEHMSDDIRATLASGGRIFLCGCGATGRLSLSLETIWREEMLARGQSDRQTQVVSFMAGGDYALVRSIENFEDHPEYGARQLNDLAFGTNDLLIGTTEGGETPFVIGAVEEAARISRRKPYMLFCNPANLLAKTVERSRQVIENPDIHSIAIETGPMAVAGSTRLQATTALMLATGAALFAATEAKESNQSPTQNLIEEFTTALARTDFSSLAPLIAAESEVYRQHGFCVHRTANYGISVLTDTTERSPTFSLLAFENALDPKAPLAWTYLVHSEAKDSGDAWKRILGRSPRALSWPGFSEKYGEGSLRGFDFSPQALDRRDKRLKAEANADANAKQPSGAAPQVHVYDIISSGNLGHGQITLQFGALTAPFARPESRLVEHLLLKVAMNISSTLAMGRLGRFRGNLMLYVRAANNKLIDRTIRYVQILLEEDGITGISYEEICRTLYQVLETLPSNEPAVLRTFEKLAPRHHRHS